MAAIRTDKAISGKELTKQQFTPLTPALPPCGGGSFSGSIHRLKPGSREDVWLE
jgi:hypothetical protein